MKSLIVVPFLFAVISQAVAQSDTIYIGHDGNRASKEEAAFYRIAIPKDGKYAVNDYSLGDDIKARGTYSSIADKGVKDGHFIFYFDNRKIHSEGNFENNIRTGIWTFFYKSTGSINNITEYIDGLYQGPFVKFDSLQGDTIRKGFYTGGRPSGVWHYYYLGSANSSKMLKDSLIIDYSTGAHTYYDRNGEITKAPNPPQPLSAFGTADDIKMPTPTFNLEDYLRTNLRYPKVARKARIQGRVVLSFDVTEDGSISNVTVIDSIGGGCDEEAVRVVKNMPKWTPGTFKGATVKVLFRLPITFKLQ